MTKAERDRFDGLYGRCCILEVENDSLVDLIRLLLQDRLTDAQLRRKVKHLVTVLPLLTAKGIH